MKTYILTIALGLVPIGILAADEPATSSKFAAEFAKRWAKTSKLAVAVAEAMPENEYAFRPDPPSMNFGEQMLHIAWANYAFCHALKDEAAPPASEVTEKTAIVKILGESQEYCSAVISATTVEQMNRIHSTPDGKLDGDELLLALYVHLAHHRGQAEVYLRDKGIKPPSYVF